MKPPPFTYHAPTTLEQALARLDEAGEDAKVLAGGQSLVPMMNMRLAAPAVLVDVNGVEGLDGIEVDADGVRVGATVRHSDLEHHAEATSAIPLLAQALSHVAHPVIRNRGTVVGSLVHADPAGELPAVLVLLGGEVELARRGGQRHVDAGDFFVGPLESAIEPGELATSATFRRPSPGTGSAFEELARRHGDYAMAGVAATVTLDADRHVSDARAVFFGVGGVPVLVELAATCRGQAHDATDFGDAIAHARDQIEPWDDIHASGEYRRHLAGVLLDRALGQATARATGARKGATA